MPSFSTPLKLGPILLKNRVIMASMTRDRNLVPGPLQVDYYTQRSGAGLILTEGILIDAIGTEWSNAPGLYTDAQVDGWKKVIDSVHERKSFMFAQLWHVGRVAHPLLQAGRPNIGPSAIAAKGGKFRQLPGSPGYVTPEPIKDPLVYIKQYKKAAERAKQSGFDGVELHSANGYLPHQFIDNTSNKRTDEWGGSAENRCRFALRTIDELCDVYGNDRVGIKLSPGGGYNDMGMPENDTLETYSYLISQLNARRLAYVQLARYWPLGDPDKRGTPIDVLQFKRLIKSEHTALFINTDFSVEEGERTLRTGLADAIVYGRFYIANPDLAERLIANQELNTNYNMKGFYGGGVEGYTDYPTYEQQKMKQLLFNKVLF